MTITDALGETASEQMYKLFLEPSFYPEAVEREMTATFLPPTGTFVEIGAFHPRELSQTWHLEQRGWNGILVEPVPAHAASLRADRKARVFEIACGSPECHGTQTKLYVQGPHTTAERYDNRPVLEVQVATASSLIDQAGLKAVDFLSVDVEGAELDVLRGFPFDRLRPRLVLVEDFGEGLAKHRFMNKLDYRRVRRVGNNSWYIPRDGQFVNVSVYGELQLIRKFYLSLPIRKAKAAIKAQFRSNYSKT